MVTVAASPTKCPKCRGFVIAGASDDERRCLNCGWVGWVSKGDTPVEPEEAQSDEARREVPVLEQQESAAKNEAAKATGKYEFGTRVMVKPYSQAQVALGVFAPVAWYALKETPKGVIAVRESDWELLASQAAQAGRQPSEVVSDSNATYLPKEYVAAFDEQAYKKLSTLGKQVDGLRRKAQEIWSKVLES